MMKITTFFISATLWGFSVSKAIPNQPLYTSAIDNPIQPANVDGLVLPAGPIMPPTSSTSIYTLSVTPAPFTATTAVCTSTMSVTPSQTCAWDGTETVYDATVTSYYLVDCYGCQSVTVLSPTYFCPNELISQIVTADTPSTTWTTVCSPTIELKTSTILSSRANHHHRVARQDVCPTTRVLSPPLVAGPVSTVYQSTATQTVLLNCGGCLLVVQTQAQGFGPPGAHTSTTTAAVTTSSVYICA